MIPLRKDAYDGKGSHSFSENSLSPVAVTPSHDCRKSLTFCIVPEELCPGAPHFGGEGAAGDVVLLSRKSMPALS